MPFRVSTSLAFGFGFALSALAQTPPATAPADPRTGDFLVVDCLLPGQIRRLGGRTTYLSARRAVRTAARDCRIRGGEYVEYDRADWRSALGAWQPQAEAGDAEAQTIVGEIFELSEEAVKWLQTVPYKGSLPTAVPTDPLIYRFYELINVYGTTFKELIHEEFGDGIMSAIDFNMDLAREADPKGDRVKIVMSGKFLSYKTY